MTIMVFDLDGTMHSMGTLYPDTVPILRWAELHGIDAHVASFNPMAKKLCQLLGIDGFFRTIQEGNTRTKLDMIREILRNYPQSGTGDVMFFDDDEQNIEHVVQNSSVSAVWCPTGLTWESVSTAWRM